MKALCDKEPVSNFLFGGHMSGNLLTIAIVYGGRSPEHEVSLRSARSVFEAIDRKKYVVIPVYITKQGEWYQAPSKVESFTDPATFEKTNRLIFSPDPCHQGLLKISPEGFLTPLSADVFFPALHGMYGEDGTLQGLMDLAGVPYVGCGTLASAVGMDKVIMKAAFRDASIKVGPFFWFLNSEWINDPGSIIERMKRRDCPLFIKPANLGSSVGISRVTRPDEFERAIELAFSFDRKILVEDAIIGRELEVGVLGNDEPQASVPGEIVSHSVFYDYQEKYLEDTAELIIPAVLAAPVAERAKKVAVAAFKAVDGSGLARVDMFLDSSDQIVINEINTLPGFTSVSMYPKLWEASGLSYESLIDRLIELAFERHAVRSHFSTDRYCS